LASTAGDPWLLSAAAVAKCQSYLQAGEFAHGAAAAEAALAGTLELHPRVKAALLYNSALGHLQHEEGRASIPFFEQAASLQRQLGQSYELSSSLHNLSVARWLLGDCAPALPEAMEALAIRRELHDRAREAYSLMAVAKDHFCLGDAQRALDTYAEVAPLWTELKDQANQAAVLNDRGLLYSYLGDSGQARNRAPAGPFTPHQGQR
jgi:tetratricopeptide (TPR) repeat protein